MTDNSEFRELLAQHYGGHGSKKRFADEAHYSQQTVSSWCNDRAECPHVVILFLRQKSEARTLAEYVDQWAARLCGQ